MAKVVKCSNPKCEARYDVSALKAHAFECEYCGSNTEVSRLRDVLIGIGIYLAVAGVCWLRGYAWWWYWPVEFALSILRDELPWR